ncbi:MAG: HEPN domain-containing protein [Acidobacteriota bacterium]
MERITLCCYRKRGLAPLEPKHRRTIRRAVDSLIFSSVAEATKTAVQNNNRSWGPPTADAFTLYFQQFDPKNNLMAVRAGSTLHGLTVGTARFTRPYSIGGTIWAPPEEPLKGLRRCLSRGDSQVRERIFRSLEWFVRAHQEEEGRRSSFTSVVMMATAFEVLLEFPTFSKTAYFVETIDKRLSSTDLRTRTRRFGKNGQKRQRVNLPAFWAGQFYDLRSRIVHGSPLSERNIHYTSRNQRKDAKWLSHLIVADLIFYELVLRELFDRDLLIPDVGALTDGAEDRDGFRRALFGMFCGFSRVYDQLGWRKQERASRC